MSFPTDILHSQLGEYSALEVAQAYSALGFSPLPLCGPLHDCISPGKIPHVRNWSRFATTSPTPEELSKLFYFHRDNIGLAIRPGMLVLDIDARSGGMESLDIIQLDHGELPETPQAFTGGGGQHLLFTIPQDFEPPAGGSLADVGYPGLEWKAAGGQIVVAPSIHTSGAAYTWEATQSPEQIDMAPAPKWLIELVAKASGHKATSTNASRKDAVGGTRHSNQDVDSFFRRTYSEGERRSSQGLPRLIGLLISRKVSLICAQAFLQTWQLTHFTPPLDQDVLDEQVTSMYHRFGEPDATLAHAGEHWLDVLMARLYPKPKKGELPTPVADAVEAALKIEAKERTVAERRALSDERNNEWYPARRGEPITIPDPKCRELSHGDKGIVLGILPRDNRKAMSDADLLDMVQRVTTQLSKVAQSIEECGWRAGMVCADHGERFCTNLTCKSRLHHSCPSRLTMKIRLIPKGRFDNLGPGESYAVIEFGWPVDMEDPALDIYATEQETWRRELERLTHRKRFNGHFLAHSTAVYLSRGAYGLGYMTGRIILRECQDGDVQEVIANLTRAKSKLPIDKHSIKVKYFECGEQVVLQGMEDAAWSFLGMANEGDDELFDSYYHGTRGLQHFTPLGDMRKALAEAPKHDERMVCEICGKRLVSVTKPPEDTVVARASMKEPVAAVTRPPPRGFWN